MYSILHKKRLLRYVHSKYYGQSMQLNVVIVLYWNVSKSDSGSHGQDTINQNHLMSIVHHLWPIVFVQSKQTEFQWWIALKPHHWKQVENHIYNTNWAPVYNLPMNQAWWNHWLRDSALLIRSDDLLKRDAKPSIVLQNIT